MTEVYIGMRSCGREGCGLQGFRVGLHVELRSHRYPVSLEGQHTLWDANRNLACLSLLTVEELYPFGIGKRALGFGEVVSFEPDNMFVIT